MRLKLCRGVEWNGSAERASRPWAVRLDDGGGRKNDPLLTLERRKAPAVLKLRQEQIQMITMVKGRATPTAPPIVNANADSRFVSACASFPDMLLLHRAQPRRQGGCAWLIKS
jgi:hypothetical protein